jgi:protein-disulfide isomerase
MSMTRMQGQLRIAVSDDDHQQGPVDAPITLVEYGDFQCPWCFRAHPIVLALQARFGTKLRFVFRNFPLTELHEHALHAAEAAESVNATSGAEAYWRMHHHLYEHQQDFTMALDDAHLIAYAAAIGGDSAQVAKDLESGVHKPRVDADFMSGVRSGVNGTPTFFINGQRFDGEWLHIDSFAAALEAALG